MISYLFIGNYGNCVENYRYSNVFIVGFVINKKTKLVYIEMLQIDAKYAFK